jgi:WhiB family redox-sensing transcriptional regulator
MAIVGGEMFIEVDLTPADERAPESPELDDDTDTHAGDVAADSADLEPVIDHAQPPAPANPEPAEPAEGSLADKVLRILRSEPGVLFTTTDLHEEVGATMATYVGQRDPRPAGALRSGRSARAGQVRRGGLMAHHGTYTRYQRGCRCEECQRLRLPARAPAPAPVDARRADREARAQPLRDLLGVESPDWYELARCRGVDQRLFFPERGDSQEPAKALFRECPVSVECLAWALDHKEAHGIWGGAGECERRRMRKGWARVA